MKTMRRDEDAVFTDKNPLIQRLLDQAEGLIYQFQFFPDTNLVRFPFASAGLWNVYEVTPDEVKYDATPALRRIHKDDLKEVNAVMHESMSAMQVCNYDFRVILPSRGLRWMRGNGRPEKLADGSFLWNGCITDITEQKKLELTILESKQRLQFALESSRDGVWDWNVKEDKIYYSEESLKILGYESYEKESTAVSWGSRVHPDDKYIYFKNIKEHFEEETEYYSNEYRVKCKSGNYKWILDRGKVIECDKDGAPLRVIGTHTDISKRKQKEEEDLKKINIIGEQNNRLLNFAHIVSHNLGTHAGNFKMLMRMINETSDVVKKLEMVEYLNKVSDSLTDTISHLNEVVSVQTQITNQLKRINLSKYIEKALSVLKGEIDLREAVIINKISSNLFLDYNPAYLESILLNLLSNALKYQHPDRNPRIELTASYKKGSLVLNILDNGIGIDLNKYGHKIFGMYETFHGNKEAKGIGLFITKNQIEALGGIINVNSELNVGTSFEIIFNAKNSNG